MTEKIFRKVFERLLYNYWGAFHEVLEAQSVTRRRLAGSLFTALQAEHRAFAAMYVGAGKSALDGLGNLWQDFASRRHQFPDPALTRDDVARAQRLFEELHQSLVDEGRKFPAAQQEILRAAPHGRPGEPLRADAAR